MSVKPAGWKRWLWPLRSRKVLVALGTVVAAYLAEAGLNVNEEIIYTILGLGVALILGIAHEDAGAKAGAAKILPIVRTVVGSNGDGKPG